MGDPYERLDDDPFDDDVLDELVAEELERDDSWVDPADALREALAEDFADATPEELDDVLCDVLESLPPAESVNFTRGLQQLQKGIQDPVVGQLATTALPLAGGAVGTALGGPVGTAVGTGFGQAAASTLAQARKGAAPQSATAATRPPGAKPVPPGGSPAAAKGFLLTQEPQVLKGLLALALGEHGRKSVDGVPVATMMGLLSSLFAQAAADAEGHVETWDAEGDGAAERPPARARSLYAALVGGEDDYLPGTWAA